MPTINYFWTAIIAIKNLIAISTFQRILAWNSINRSSTCLTIAAYFNGFRSPDIIMTMPTTYKDMGNFMQNCIPYLLYRIKLCERCRKRYLLSTKTCLTLTSLSVIEDHNPRVNTMLRHKLFSHLLSKFNFHTSVYQE